MYGWSSTTALNGPNTTLSVSIRPVIAIRENIPTLGEVLVSDQWATY